MNKTDISQKKHSMSLMIQSENREKESEVWKDVVGWEGLYKVSNFGNVLSIRRNKLLTPYIDHNGYIKVVLSLNGQSHKAVHRLMAEAFIPNPDNKPYIDHINTIRGDNRLENLRWVTSKENNNNPISIENSKLGQSHKFTPILQFSLSGELLNEYPSQREAARVTGVGRTSIRKCCQGTYHTAGGFKWKYK